MRLVFWNILGASFLATSACSRPAAEAAAQNTIVEASADSVRETPSGPSQERTAEDFQFPDDRGGRLLAELLPPKTRLAFYPAESPRPRPASSSAIDRPTAPLPPSQANPVRLPLEIGRTASRPGPAPDDVPLVLGDGPLPPPIRFAVGPRVGLPSPDVNQPTPLPISSHALSDRAPIDDPTADHSLAAAIAVTPPNRTQPAPFLRLIVPDPFEYRKPVQKRDEQQEEVVSPIAPSLPARK